ncbi:DnaJ-class molecular chaperone [Methanonatronarchaeum thermophilum]|uniref:Chaperone protein DnaJ n=1 Tax=Methanonatronarchaeum thermophilum TaxID=1927129 RepID=A0A1Y3GJ16_9EURY|nr:molecular chaperone DnaJ [Methanonatronarchaeum thermophilum]OUJ19386.1 DnaJ-class molecular chaperone [Methanonatronarchaeum thermophilum]
MAEDYYKILGVDKEASQKEIKKAYRRKAKKYHPDSGSEESDEEKFKKINEAYQVLSDQEKRQKYDRFGKSGINGDFRQRARTQGFDDIFSSFFGDIFNNSDRRKRNLDIAKKIKISLEDAYNGTEKTISIRRLSKCKECNGKGSKDPDSIQTCNECRGTGETRRVREGMFGRQIVVTECPECEGAGQIINNPCTQCSGEGRHYINDEVSINIPKGVNTGQKLKIDGKGHKDNNTGQIGHLIIIVEVKEDEIFERRDENLFYTLKMGFPDAALGSKAKIPTLNGDVQLDIPSGTQNGDVFRLKGKGMPRLQRRGYGDLYIKAVVETPTDLTEREKEILQELRQYEGKHKEPDKGFFQTVKDNIKDAL